MSKWIIAVWIVIVPWYVVTGVTAGPAGPLGLTGPLGIVGFHLVSASLTALALWPVWRWRTVSESSAARTLLVILGALLAVATLAHLTMAIVTVAEGGTAAVFQAPAWRTGSILALLVTLPIFGVLIGASLVEAIAARRMTRQR